MLHTIDTYLEAYGHNIMPMRDRALWEQVEGPIIHPPVYKKRMGRPPKNRKKTPEEKLQKDGSIALNRKGVNMHCSICGKADHNKKGHQKFMEREANELEEEIDTSILNDIRTHIEDTRMDPMHVPTSMVYRMRQEERIHVSNVTNPGPLPEMSRFVADARDSIPERRSTTTATARGRISPINLSTLPAILVHRGRGMNQARTIHLAVKILLLFTSLSKIWP